jgi:hypothetical protein
LVSLADRLGHPPVTETDTTPLPSQGARQLVLDRRDPLQSISLQKLII